MNELGLPPLLSSACVENWKRVENSGREIDQEFIRRGFVSIQAEIEFMNKVFGSASYDVFLEIKSSSQSFENFRSYDDDVRGKLASARNTSDTAYKAMWDKILHDPHIPSFSKSNFLAIMSQEKYDALISPHVPLLLEARKEEEKNVCKLFPEPAIPLHQKSATELRKEVFNRVMADSYGPLGFEILRRNKGVESYVKTLTAEYAIILEPDVVLMDKDYSRQWTSALIYWPLIPFSRSLYLGSPKKKDRHRYVSFLPIANCIAADRLNRYDDTRSFEVMIRASALWYELTVVPFEDSVRELAS